ncbi:sigma-70 family RNA polymerase sigma factor [Intrasporangium sp. YIM S08009]|uniref:sigma-70 family RNA polymerase sigma factor n=1 Tax=Intrasporangium zincisolvens TaxID=3080018 RepID=UPI002B052095|nr:sigma-70 family RNA polymerase sigma factor [Intrasporangium sp. YIM S08009]
MRTRDDLQRESARVHAERDARTDALFAELHLVEDIDSPDGRRVVDQIFALHTDLCDGLARRYCNRGIERDDLLQVARLALLKAIHRYRPRVGASFAGFAVPTVSGELKRHFRDHGWMVRPSRRVQELRLTLRQKREVITHELGRTPTRDELADALGVDTVAMGEAEGSDSSFRPLSIDLPTTPGEQNHVADAVYEDDPALERLCDHVDLGRALETLPPQTRRVLHLRFVEERTQREIANELGATQMQVSRLLGRTFRQLRAELVGDLGEPEPLAS